VTGRGPLLGAAALAAVLAAAPRAHGRERLAVLILPVEARDAALADDLTEVAIARLAERAEYELAGTLELRRRLRASGAGELPLDCPQQPACLGRVGVVLGARRALVGNVRSVGGGYLVTVAIHDLQTAGVERSFFRSVDGHLESVSRAIQDAVDDLLRPRPAAGQLRVASVPDGATVIVDDRVRGTTPLWIDPLEPGTHHVRIEMSGRFAWRNDLSLAPGQNLAISVNRDQLVPRRTWTPYAAYGGAAGAALAFGAAALFGTLARVDPSGRSRGEAQQDLDVRMTYARIANVLLATGGVLAGASAFTFIRFRRDIAGP